MRMYIVNAVLAIIFSALGLTLFLYRVLYMVCQGKSWNNPPTSVSWSWTYGAFGLAILMTQLLTRDCENGCYRVDGVAGLGLAIALLFIFTPLTYHLISVCATPYMSENDHETHQFDPDTGEDLRPPMSGFDFLFIGLGLGIFLGDILMGACPSTCEKLHRTLAS